jgi:hypothetical protein
MSGSPARRMPRSASSRLLETFEGRIEARRGLSTASENAPSAEGELEKLRADLLLSAQVGQALVTDNEDLTQRMAAAVRSELEINNILKSRSGRCSRSTAR